MQVLKSKPCCARNMSEDASARKLPRVWVCVVVVCVCVFLGGEGGGAGAQAQGASGERVGGSSGLRPAERRQRWPRAAHRRQWVPCGRGKT
jgi:hypothetical protein